MVRLVAPASTTNVSTTSEASTMEAATTETTAANTRVPARRITPHLPAMAVTAERVRAGTALTAGIAEPSGSVSVSAERLRDSFGAV